MVHPEAMSTQQVIYAFGINLSQAHPTHLFFFALAEPQDIAPTLWVLPFMAILKFASNGDFESWPEGCLWGSFTATFLGLECVSRVGR